MVVFLLAMMLVMLLIPPLAQEVLLLSGCAVHSFMATLTVVTADAVRSILIALMKAWEPVIFVITTALVTRVGWTVQGVSVLRRTGFVSDPLIIDRPF